jgi:hypothetical protein
MDSTYRERREKNNRAARRSREKKKQIENEMRKTLEFYRQKAASLMQRNARLLQEIESLNQERETLRYQNQQQQQVIETYQPWICKIAYRSNTIVYDDDDDDSDFVSTQQMSRDERSLDLKFSSPSKIYDEVGISRP